MEEESILESVKTALGVPSSDDYFSPQIIMHLNSVFAILTQLGVGPDDGFIIIDGTEVWSDYLENNNLLNFVKTYVAMRTRMLFDPPTSSQMTTAYENAIKEIEWRILAITDYKEE